MDRELAGAVLDRWRDGLPVREGTLYKAASALGIDPQAALMEARFYTHLDSYLLEKRAMTRGERRLFSLAAGIDPRTMVKTASAYGLSQDELIIAALRERDFVPNLEKLALMAPMPGQDPAGGPTPPAGAPAVEGAPSADPAAELAAPPVPGAEVQQAPEARFKPSPTAPEQAPPTPQGNIDQLLQEHAGIFGQQAQENGGQPPAGMPAPPAPPPPPEERIMQVAPNLDPETAARYGEQLTRLEQGIQMQVSDPKQMVKFVKELQKVDGKKIDQGIKAMGQELEQEQAAELGVDGTPTVDGPAGAGANQNKVMAPKPGQEAGDEAGGDPAAAAGGGGGPPGAGGPPKKKPAPAPAQAPGGEPPVEAAEKVAGAARAFARALLSH